MLIRFWGTRGSLPTPGQKTVRYGGNTPCLEVRLPGNKLVIFDAGTGIHDFGNALTARGESVNAYLAITHPHWDHIQGFPFFKPAFISGNTITIVGPQAKGASLRSVIASQMNKVYFPIQLSELQAKIKFMPVKEESVELFGATLSTIYVNHPAFALGYRLTVGGKSMVYISDNEPFDREVARSLRNVDKNIVNRYLAERGDPNRRIVEFARGADVLIHDTTYTPEEYVSHVGWGHSHYLFTLSLAEQAGVKRLILFHHDPSHDDDKIDEIVEVCRKEIKGRRLGFECAAAAEGMEVTW
jgi:phosphoribosyl 1,2-cyclic phosphodiesterase